MNELKDRIAALPTLVVQGRPYLSYQAVADTVAAFLFPTTPSDQIDEARYRRILETADTVCRELGYADVIRLTPPQVLFSAIGLYWRKAMTSPQEDEDDEIIIAGPGLVEELQSGRLVDARLSRHGLDEVARQHFNIPVTVSDGVYNLMRRAVEGPWPNDWKGLLHDLLGMCITGGKDVSPTERLFTAIIRGVGNRRYWRFKATLQHDTTGAPFLRISLADEPSQERLFELGHVVMTEGAASLNVDFSPWLAMHAGGKWGELDAFDQRQNDIAVKEGTRILSAYDVPIGNGETERIWIITEADRSVTSVILPREY
ncbi:MAG: hypothetical protein ACOC8X_14400 [Chloroflexota bacterium]